MNKWEVYRCEFPNGRRQWCAMTRADYWSDRYFDTHAEALAYADERARTVELTVPRRALQEASIEWIYSLGELYEFHLSTSNHRFTTRGATDTDVTALDDHIVALVALRGQLERLD